MLRNGTILRFSTTISYAARAKTNPFSRKTNVCAIFNEKTTINYYERTYAVLKLYSKRTMVMITQTKAGEPDAAPPSSAKDNAANSTFNNTCLPTQPHLIVTESCWKRIRQLSLKRGQSLSEMYLRVYVDAGGCSGFSYKFELDTTEVNHEDDIVFVGPEGARVVVDQGSYEFIKGSKIDYVQEMIKSNFEVKENPQSESACGCGSSFALKNFAKNPALD